MYSKLILVLFLTTSLSAFSQSTSRILEKSEVEELFNSETKTEFQINFPIFRCYEYNDNGGTHYLLLTERSTPEDNNKIDSVKGYSFTLKDRELVLDWQLKDFIIKNDNDESTIWFWTKYLSLEDLDGDGLTDPIIVYGTKGMNGFNDGRLKILTYYKGEKSGIRHQNGILDFERRATVDASIYELPETMQSKLVSIMDLISNKGQSLFASSWKEDLKAKKLVLKN